MAFHKRKAFGQHFLRDEKISTQIAQAAVVECVKTQAIRLMEIGPGKGAITIPLLQQLGEESSHLPAGFEFFLCEKDDRLAERARQEWSVRVENSDFLELSEERWMPSLEQERLVVVSNLPYSVGTAILTRLALHPERISAMVLMFQAEVARRVRATSRTSEWGSLSLWVQNHWDVERLLHVPPGAFIPPPKVDSEVIVLRPRIQPRVATQKNPALWEKLLKVCFAHRRKMLRSSLPGEGIWRNALELSGISGTKRAEELSWEEWSVFFEKAYQESGELT